MRDDQQPKGTAPVSGIERQSPADRARRIQEMQQQMESQQASPQRPATPSAQASTVSTPRPATIPDGFRAEVVKQVTSGLKDAAPTPASQSAYAKAQVDPSKLFGGDASVEVTGNPWKIIPFGPAIPAVFNPTRPAEAYDVQVPANAVKTDHGLLFQASLRAKDGSEPPKTRAVLVDNGGALRGAECHNAKEIRGLLEKAPSMLESLFTSAFEGGAAKGGRIRDVTPGKTTSYQVSLERADGATASVGVNNFAVPVPPDAGAARAADIFVAQYMLDKFEAAA